MLRLFLLISILLSSVSLSQASPVTPDWSDSATIAPTGRSNPYGWDRATLETKIRAGKLHALNYPVEATGLLVPARSALQILAAKPGDPLFSLMQRVLSLDPNMQNFTGFWDWIGLHDYPDQDSQIPFPDGVKPDYPMGVSFIQRNGVQGITLGCAACHSAELFGKPILGLTNRFPRSNEFFIEAQKLMKTVTPGLYTTFTKASVDERAMYADSRDRIIGVGLKKPAALGLDTSLAQVSLSLSRRGEDEWAERSPTNVANPRPNLLDHLVADSKPAVWWNVKYKTRWLSDGSVTSGNPVFTNFLWNEIGRGADLKPLVDWLQNNSDTVEELTTAVFATKAPRWSDYLDRKFINVSGAKRGEILFKTTCQGCHGQYVKQWSTLATTKVIYHDKTPVVDVGTDPGRHEGMQSLEDGLNPLAFSKNFNIVIQTQKGYVPPPLEGIFSRFPYLHNNSIPNLCTLMTPPAHRPNVYYSMEPKAANDGFDVDCVGYPITQTGDDDHRYDTALEGMSNSGHYEGIFTNQDGSEKFTSSQKQDLREFLKTL